MAKQRGVCAAYLSSPPVAARRILFNLCPAQTLSIFQHTITKTHKITNKKPTFVVVISSVDVVTPFAFLLQQFDLLDVPFISRLPVVQSLDYFRLFLY
jgi:hypothetical protein